MADETKPGTVKLVANPDESVQLGWPGSKPAQLVAQAAPLPKGQSGTAPPKATKPATPPKK